MKTHWSIQPSLTAKAKHRYTVLLGTLPSDWAPGKFAPNTWVKSNIGSDDEAELFRTMEEKYPELTFVTHNDLHIRL